MISSVVVYVDDKAIQSIQQFVVLAILYIMTVFHLIGLVKKEEENLSIPEKYFIFKSTGAQNIASADSWLAQATVLVVMTTYTGRFENMSK